jgi:uncharacterized protein with PIN domain
VDGRIEAGFRGRFRMLLGLVSSEELDREVAGLIERARERAGREGVALAQALAVVYDQTRDAVKARAQASARPDAGAARPEEASSPTPPWRRFTDAQPPRFLCDPSLGGLARWLRAAGYEASVPGEVPGHRLPVEALRRGLVLLTTEAKVLDRRIVADGSLLVVWLPSALTMREQLRMVMRDLGLRLREPRCMACGGAQVAASKESVRPRIPPRTALWKDEYFVCAACDRLFWQGTHWERISKALAEAAAP